MSCTICKNGKRDVCTQCRYKLEILFRQNKTPRQVVGNDAERLEVAYRVWRKMPKPWPRLSELPGEKHPNICQACGAKDDLIRWQEHDDFDRRELTIVVLCRACGKELIDSHPRMYDYLQFNEPFPGCMPICVMCVHRDGTSCNHPNSKVNSGPGMALTYTPPSRAFREFRSVGGRRRGDSVWVWPRPVADCRGRETKEATAQSNSKERKF